MTYLHRTALVVVLASLSSVAVGCSATEEEARQSESALEDRDDAYRVIHEARSDLHEKREAHAKVLDRGRDELAQIAPALTDDQIKEYAIAYANLDSSKDALGDYVDASLALAKALDEVLAKPDLFREMMTHEHGQMIAAHRELSKTPAAGATVRFVGKTLTKDDPDHLVEGALVFALPAAVFESLVKTRSVTKAIDQVCKDLSGPNGPAASVVKALSALKTSTKVLTSTDAGAINDAIRQAAAVVEIWKAGASPAGSSPTTGGNDSAKNLRAAVQSSPTAVRAIADGANMMRMAMGGREAAWLADIAAGAKVAGMGMNFALAAFDVASSFGDLDDGSDKARLLGNGASLVAAALAFTPIGAASIAVGAAAFAIKLYASYLAEKENWDLYREEKAACLAGVVADDVGVALSEAHPKHLAFFGSLGMAPADIQWLAPRIRKTPSGIDGDFWKGITSTSNGNAMLALRVADDVFRLSPKEDAALLRAAAGTGDAAKQSKALWLFFGMLEYQPNASGWKETISTTTALEILSQRASLDASGPEGRAAFTRARTYLAGLRR